ncbi:Mechanosensitive ion channel-domain-containing protein, partial [Spinellus fusiger]
EEDTIPLTNANTNTPRSYEYDDDDEFDWNDDDQEKSKRDSSRLTLQKPCCWHFLSPFMKRLIIAFIGSCVFISIAVCVYFLLPRPSETEMEDPNFTNVRSNVQLWMYWSAIMWHIGWITTVLIELFPSVVSLWTKCFWGRRSERVKSAMEYYMAVKLYTGIFLVAIWNWGVWAFLIAHPFSSVNSHAYSGIIWKVFACLFAASCFLFVQKSIIQLIATRFHRLAYRDRLHESKVALKILDSLSQSEHHRAPPEAVNGLRNRHDAQGHYRPESSLPSSKHRKSAYSSGVFTHHNDQQRPSHNRHTSAPGAFSQFQRRLHNLVVLDHPERKTRIENDKVDINSNEFAKKVAKKLFYSLANPYGLPIDEQQVKRSLDINDFLAYFKTQEEAKKAFSIFDKDSNGDLSRREFRDTVVDIYRERKALSQSIRDTSQALGKIDALLLIISCMVTLLVTLAIFNVNVWQSLVPFGSLLLALTFVFGNTCKMLFESVLFLFVTHPYDAGDYVLIDDNYLRVHNMGLMGTVFIRSDGQKVYAPTPVLMTKMITNVRRSGNMGESIVINIDFRTRTEDVLELKSRMSQWVNQQTRDFTPGFDLRVINIIDVNQLILSMSLTHKGNWQDLGKRWQRHSRFMIALKDILTDLDIVYELPSQKIRHTKEISPFEKKESPTNNPFEQNTVSSQHALHLL